MSTTARKIIATGGLLLSLAAPSAHAYNNFELYGDPSLALKWGTSNSIGTPGGIVTWSFMPDGTTLDTSAPSYIHGTSNLSSVFNQVGGASIALPWIQSAFTQWSSYASISFVQVGDDGTPFNAVYDASQVIGNIRIGAFAIDGYVGAVGFAPPPNGGTALEGDVIFNSSNTFGIAPGNEGDLYELYPASNNYYYLNDLPGLFLHELGHAIGLDHSGVATSVMCGYHYADNPQTVCDYADLDQDGMASINRELEADDIAGIQHIYGAAVPVPEPSGYATLLAGLVLIAGMIRRRIR